MGREVCKNGHGLAGVEILGEVLVEKTPTHDIYDIYLKGYHPEFGERHEGFQGEETKVRKEVSSRAFVNEWQNP